MYDFITQDVEAGNSSVSFLCKVFKVNRSSYYDSLQKSRKAIQDEKDITRIKELHQKDPSYGYRRMALATGFSENKAYRLMKKAGLKSVIRRKKRNMYSPASRERGIIVDNIVDRNFSTNKPLKKLHCDISYVKTDSNVVRYLCSIVDAFNQEIIAFNVTNDLSVKSILTTLDSLKEKLPDSRLDEILLHTDRGTHFTSEAWHKKIRELAITPSMSAKACPADNAPIESFFSTYKTECIRLYKPKNAREIEYLTEKWIDYYNNSRIALRLGTSPVNYRENLRVADLQ